ncbi:MAG: cyanase [Opitutales bacterium]|nr:cyanase [Opitutales bacterium]
MTKEEMIHHILEAKKAKKASWADLAKASGLSEVFTTSSCLGENSLDAEAAGKVATFLDLGEDIAEALTEYPMKGEKAPTVAKDPTIYRFQEIIYVYGETLKELIDEKFGPGIMSAIDFTMDVNRIEDPKGDRVKIVMNGKFLGYKKW